MEVFIAFDQIGVADEFFGVFGLGLCMHELLESLECCYIVVFILERLWNRGHLPILPYHISIFKPRSVSADSMISL